jgi:hypothetical protein
VIVGLLIILSAVVTRIRAGELPQAISIPSPILPSPNARDTFNAAEALEKDGNEVNTAQSPRTDSPPPSENINDPKSAWHIFSMHDKLKLIAENQPSIEKMRKGLSQESL